MLFDRDERRVSRCRPGFLVRCQQWQAQKVRHVAMEYQMLVEHIRRRELEVLIINERE